MDSLQRISSFLTEAKWIEQIETVYFLAAGEYNENYVVVDGEGKRFVLRINHGSQLGLSNQIEYEFTVLKALESSGVTPHVFYYDLQPEKIDGGVLLMEHLPGSPLNYQHDRDIAAGIFARIHSLPVSNKLIVQRNPILDIARECYELLTRFKDHPLQEEQSKLLKYHTYIMRLGENSSHLFKNETMCIVNTEVNSHNFLIEGGKGYLVDWEKAVASYRYQDLGHFLAATTTRWKSDYTFSESEKMQFLKSYSQMALSDVPFSELVEKTMLLDMTILLRGLSWCHMAYYEYTATERPLKNRDTFRIIDEYMKGIDWFLKGVDYQ
jgi:thiamine kinase-like enzyme